MRGAETPCEVEKEWETKEPEGEHETLNEWMSE